MSPILAAILISTNLTVFFSFLSLKVDNSIKWNWFIVFIPLFFLEFLFFIHGLILLKRGVRYKLTSELVKLLFYFVANTAMVTFQILLCLKLELFYASLKLTYVFIPFWCLLLILLFYLLQVLSSLV